jgi:predicted secreted hydrolase
VKGGPGVSALALLAAGTIALGACTNGGVLRAAVPTAVPLVTPSPSPVKVADPLPLSFPRDEGPHHRLTEWWYDTGHLQSGDGRDFGFEFVVFRAERGAFPVAWASHFAITDSVAGMFRDEERTEFGPQVDASPPAGGFDLTVRGSPPENAPWTMRGGGGRDHLSAQGLPGTIDLDLSTDRPPVLHDGDGWIDLGPAGGTYYYSRTRLEVAGTFVRPGGFPLPVTGEAWFDHQWGDFIAVGAGGWDWFSVQLDDGRDLTISLVHGPGGVEVLDYGTLVAAEGSARHLTADQFRVTTLGRWTSPHSGADYPAAWRIELPGEHLAISLQPTLADQELDTTASTGAIYWEGEVAVEGTDGAGHGIAGRGYVELTGYAK